MAWTLPGPSFDSAREVLRSVRVISSSARARDSDNFYVVTPRMVQGDNFTPLGSWDQSSFNLAAGTPRELLDARHKNKRMPDGRGLQVHIDQTGYPADIVGVSVEFVFEKAGGTAAKETPWLSEGADARTEETQTLVTRLNEAKIGQRTAVVQLFNQLGFRWNAALGYAEYWDGSTWLKVPESVSLDTYIDRNQKFSVENIHGDLSAIVLAQPLSLGVPIVIAKGSGKIVFLVNAGGTTTGDMTITGTSVDRNTGATTGSDTETISMTGVSTDATATDAQGNFIYDWTGAYISSKWWTGTVTMSTAALNITDMDVYSCSFEQFNDRDTVVTTFDVSCKTTNAGAWGYWYLFSVVVDKPKVDISLITSLSITIGFAKANRTWRLRRGRLTKALDGSSDGIFVQQSLGPNNFTYFDDLTMKIWGVQ